MALSTQIGDHVRHPTPANPLSTQLQSYSFLQSSPPTLLALPQEVLNNIYEHIFEGITVRPQWKQRQDLRSSRRAMLLVCKTQHKAALQVMWKSATLVLETLPHLTAFTMCCSADVGRMVRAVDVRADILLYAPFLLGCELFNLIPNMQYLTVWWADMFANYSSGGPSPLEGSMKTLLKYATYEYDMRRLLGHKIAVANEQNIHVTVAILIRPPEFERSYARFDTDTWTLRYSVGDEVICVPQTGLDVVLSTLRTDLTAYRNHLDEKKMMQYFLRIFPHRPMDPDGYALMHRGWDWLEVLHRGRPGIDEILWTFVQPSLQGSFDDDDEPDDDAINFDIEALHELWAHILNINDPVILARPYKPAFQQIDEVGPLGVKSCFEDQKIFFKALFDPSQDRLPQLLQSILEEVSAGPLWEQSGSAAGGQ